MGQMGRAVTFLFIQPMDVSLDTIDLRALTELELQIQTLQPTFGTACLALNTDKFSLERDIIARRLTPGRCAYSMDGFQSFSLRTFIVVTRTNNVLTDCYIQTSALQTHTLNDFKF
jgi:hypothetical protein